MRESTGNALLMTTMTSVIAIVLSFLVGSISYSKSYRVKNYIINEITQQKRYGKSVVDSNGLNTDLDHRISIHLQEVGYRINYNDCPDLESTNDGTIKETGYKLVNLNELKDYDVCIYKSKSNESYVVMTFMRFDFPVVNQFVNFKIKGRTKVFD